MALESHANGFRSQQEKNEDGLTMWQTIELMSQAAMSYSGTREQLQFVQEITSRVSIKSINKMLQVLSTPLALS